MRAVQPSLSCTFLKDHCVGGRIISKAHRGFGVEEAVYNERSRDNRETAGPLGGL